MKGGAAVKEKEIFDKLVNAEDDTMDILTDMCPEITDAELDRLLAVTERKYKMKKKDKDRAEKDNDITMSENEVSGVERVRRPAWLTPIATAASVVLVAGIVLGSVIMLNRQAKSGNGSGVDQPAVTATTADTTEITTTATGTSVTNTASTTQTTTETTAETTLYTTVPFVAPAAEDIYVDNELGDIALELFKEYDEIDLLRNAAGVEVDTQDGLRFAADPEVEIRSTCYDTHQGEKGIAYYIHVTDSRFSCLEDIRRYLRSVLSEGLYERLFGDSMASGFDELEQNEVLDKEHMKQWIEYRGKLYQYCPYGGWGKLPVIFSDSYPVIIADKTETSCTAYFPEWYIEVDNFENCICMEVKLILDPEFNDWRIDNVQQFEGRHYGELYDMLNS